MNREIVAGVRMVAGALGAAVIPLAVANASGSSDVDPFADALGPSGAALDSILPASIAFQLDKLVDAFPPFDPNDFAVSVNGVTLFQVGTATAQSGTGDIAIADGADSKAIAGGPIGQFDTAVANGADSIATDRFGNYDSAFADGANSVANAGGGPENISNDDLAAVFGADSNAAAGALAGEVSSSNDVALVFDQLGSIGSSALAVNGNFDYASVLGDSGLAEAGDVGNFDIAQVLADGLTATATGGSFLVDVVP